MRCHGPWLRLAAAAFAAAAAAADSDGPGVIRSLSVSPPGCELDPPQFSPSRTFYVVDCPESAEAVLLRFTSSSDLLGADGRPVPRPLRLALSAGEVTFTSIRACRGEGLCTTYEFDVHRRGSSQAALEDLLITSGTLDAEVSPEFDPAVTDYEAWVPYGATAAVSAAAAKDGFVSFDAFAAADRHVAARDFQPDRAFGKTMVRIFVVSADREGETEYRVVVRERPSDDAGLAAIRSNVGTVKPVGGIGSNEFMLTVPPGSVEVGVSVTARDREGATVQVQGESGIGYCSTVLQLHPDAAYQLVRITIQAADHVTMAEYILIVLSQDMGSTAMLSSLIVRGCVNGLQPPFQVSVHNYGCTLDNLAEEVVVLPTAMWLPEGQGHMALAVQGRPWQTGVPWRQPLDSSGTAEVSVEVTSPDGAHYTAYVVRATGSPENLRGPLFTTTSPPVTSTTTTSTTSTTSTTTSETTSTTSAPRPRPPIPLEPERHHGSGPTTSTAPMTSSTSASRTFTSTTTTRTTSLMAYPWLPTTPPARLRRFHFHLPPLPAAVWRVAAVAFDLITVGAPLVALLACQSLAAGFALLRALQTLALAAALAPPGTPLARLAFPLGLFNFRAPVQGVRCRLRRGAALLRRQESRRLAALRHRGPESAAPGRRAPGAAPPQRRRRRRGRRRLDPEAERRARELELSAGAVVIISACLPVVLLFLVVGWLYAAQEERMASERLLSDLGQRGPRARLLPCALVALDVGMVGFANAAALLTFGHVRELDVRGTVVPISYVHLLLVAYPVAFSAFGLLYLCRLRREGRLVWSPLLGLFGDQEALAVSLPWPTYSALAAASEGPTLLEWLLSDELRSVVPLQDPAGGPLRVGDLGGRPAVVADGCLFGAAPPQDLSAAALLLQQQAEAEAGLLPSKARRLTEWQRHQERLGLLLWMDRRCAAYEALQRQITQVGHGSRMTDAQGLPLYDRNGDCLADLYQYCCYQFPGRPWWPPVPWAATSVQPEVAEPVDRAGGILAAWVPPAAAIGPSERRRIDSWLDRWLGETEAVLRARDALLQLRWRSSDSRAREDQAALLQEVALAVLLGEDLRMPKEHTAEEAEAREAKLTDICTERRRRGNPPPWQPEVDLLAPHEALASLHADLINSDEYPLTDQDLQKAPMVDAVCGFRRVHLRTPGPVTRAVAPDGPSGPVPRPRITLAACALPARHIRLLTNWLPPFGMCVPLGCLKLPIRERWLPLFASCSTAAQPVACVVDAVERLMTVATVILAQWLLSPSCPLGHAVPVSAVLLVWRAVALTLRALCGASRHDAWIISGPSLQLSVLICLALSESERVPASLHKHLLERLLAMCGMGVFLAAVLPGISGARQLAGLLVTRPRPPDLPILGLGDDPEGTPAPVPPFGEFVPVDAMEDGAPLPLVIVVPALGLALHGEACREPGVATDERRAAGWRKRLAALERPPPDGGGTTGRPQAHVLHLKRYREEVRHALPLVFSRAQLAGTDEVRELACTIHVINHAGCSWADVRHDSFLSLYKPWGLDTQGLSSSSSTRPSSAGPGSAPGETERRERYRHTPDSPALVKAWRDEVVDWLQGELAANSSVEHTAQDCMLDARRSDRDPYRTEADKRIVPGIFSADGIGEVRYSDSRCFKEGRVLHYVVLSTELKSSITWRPDPLAAHHAELLCGDQGWRPCLLRLGSRSLSYSLRRRDGEDCGGPCPEWKEKVWRDHGDIVDYNVPFFFLDRLEVDVPLGLLTLHERDTSMAGPEPGILPDYAPRHLPLVLRVGSEMAPIWDQLIRQYRMFSRPQHIVNYVGQVCEHPRLPGIVCRDGPEGEQLWDDGSRYVGSWQAHVYHGQGQLVDTMGGLIYKGEWQNGMKHGEGTYYFSQEGTRRAYRGQWVRDEFRGAGELWVLEESLPELTRARPHTVIRYQGQFASADGQFPRPPNLLKLELEKHAAIIKAHFPTRPATARAAELAPPGAALGPAVQYGGEAPRDYAQELYGLEGADLRHCGPDQDCEIVYADGTRYMGPCLAGAVPHGAGGHLTEPNGTTYEGGFDRGLRSGPARVDLANGISYHGQFGVPGGHRHGDGCTTVPEGSLQKELVFASHTGEYSGGLREGHGEMTFSDGSQYVGGFHKNQRHGEGRQTESTAAAYEGPWVEDKPGSGMAYITYASGYHYEGMAVSGLRHGEGKMFAPLYGMEKDELVYEGQWEEDEMHGAGKLHAEDGVYKGQFVRGLRSGHGRFDYLFPKPGSALPQPPSAREAGALSKPRSYEGQWERDQPHGVGTYKDEYGYTNENARFASGRLSSDRRPPIKSCAEKFLSNPKWPTEEKFLPIRTEASPIAVLPRGREVCRNKGTLPAVEPAALHDLDVGSGYAHGRLRPAHAGLEGVPGTRWA